MSHTAALGARTYDIIIVGAGSAGCVLAARLADLKPHSSILLIEAGPYYPELSDHPRELAHANSMSAIFPGHPNNWSFIGQLMPGHPFPMPRGRLVGGSSAVNATVFLRGRPEDFADWAADGNDQWSFDKVLPYYIKSETDVDFSNEYHGKAGPIFVRRTPPSELHPLSEVFLDSCGQRGFTEEIDKNGTGREGYGRIPSNNVNGLRVTTGMAYLANRGDKDNLVLLADSEVRRILFTGTQAIGVEVLVGGEISELYGNEIILCAGGIKSSHILQVSGIGPADTLRQVGVDVVHDSPGVGTGVMDHPGVPMRFRIDARMPDLDGETMPLQTSLNFADPGVSTHGDLQIICVPVPLNDMLREEGSGSNLLGKVPVYVRHPLATAKAVRKLPMKFLLNQALSSRDYQFICTVEQERSRGTISLSSADPAVPPVIDLNYLSDPEDFRLLRTCVRTCADIIGSTPFAKLGARRVGLSAPVLSSDAELDGWIATNISSSFHTSCAARMGLPDDPLAVVDQECRVYGVNGLRIVDVSVMPKIVRRATNATAIMIAERVADLI
jgi:choline dehydrogenase